MSQYHAHEEEGGWGSLEEAGSENYKNLVYRFKSQLRKLDILKGKDQQKMEYYNHYTYI